MIPIAELIAVQIHFRITFQRLYRVIAWEEKLIQRRPYNEVTMDEASNRKELFLSNSKVWTLGLSLRSV